MPLAEALAAAHAEVVVCDPYVAEVSLGSLPYERVPFNADELAAADIVVVMVDHPSFDPELIATAAPLVFDAKGLLRGREFHGEVL